MSIEKFHDTYKNECLGFTTLYNSSAELIKDPAALGVYFYLASKPNTWMPRVDEVGKRFNMSKDRTYRLFKVLMDLGLLSRNEIRVSGRFAYYEYVLHITRKVTEESQNNLPNQDLPDTVFPDTENPDAYKRKTIENKDNNNTLGDSVESPKKKAKVDLSNYQKDNRFMYFYERYPKKLKPRDAYRAFLRIKPDDDLLKKIIYDVEQRIKKDPHWENKQFIPYPASYLNSAYWESEITTKNMTNISQAREEQRRIEQQRELQKRLDEQDNHVKKPMPEHLKAKLDEIIRRGRGR